MHVHCFVLGLICLSLIGCQSEASQPELGIDKSLGDRQTGLVPNDSTDTGASASEPGTNTEATCIDSWVADGWCDIQNNRETCGFDGGDCCPSTCEDSMYFCGDYQWICIDPDACETTGECDPAPDNIELTYEEFCDMYPGVCEGQVDCDAYPELCDPELYCEAYPEHCVTYEDYCEQYPADPICEFLNSEASGDTESTWPFGEGCIESYVGDGWCDHENNNEACGWDAGDCCPSTCIPSQFSCSESRMECLDPSACENLNDDDEPCDEPVSQFCITNPEYCAYYECLSQPDADPQECYDETFGCEDFPEFCE